MVDLKDLIAQDRNPPAGEADDKGEAEAGAEAEGEGGTPEQDGGGRGGLGLDLEPMVPPKPRSQTALRLVVVFVGLLMVGGGAAWYFVGGSLEDGGDLDVPTVHAERGPVKVRPDSPGGMDVPNRDKLVYNRMREGDVEDGKVEHLLPPAEEPAEQVPDQPAEAPQPQPEPQESAEAPASAETPAETPPAPPAAPADKVAEAPPPADPVPGSEPPVEPEIAEALKADEKVEPMPAEPEDSAEAAAKQQAMAPPQDAGAESAPEPEAEAEPAVAPPTAEDYRVQLVAVRTQPAAEKAWDRFRKAHPELLGDLKTQIVRADLGDRGVFYRLRAGPLDSEAAAKDLCADLKRRQVGCLVVRPGS